MKVLLVETGEVKDLNLIKGEHDMSYAFLRQLNLVFESYNDYLNSYDFQEDESYESAKKKVFIRLSLLSDDGDRISYVTSTKTYKFFAKTFRELEASKYDKKVKSNIDKMFDFSTSQVLQ